MNAAGAPFWDGPWGGMASIGEIIIAAVAILGIVIAGRNLVLALNDHQWLVFSEVNGPRRVQAVSNIIHEALTVLVFAMLLSLGALLMTVPPATGRGTPEPSTLGLTVLTLSLGVEAVMLFKSSWRAYTRVLLRRSLNEEEHLLREEVLNGKLDGPKNLSLDKALARDGRLASKEIPKEVATEVEAAEAAVER